MLQRRSAAVSGADQLPVEEAPAATGYARPMVFQDAAERRLQRFIDESFQLRPHDTVLDVGCGFVLPIDVPIDVRLVGLDIDSEALAKNANVDDAIVGDIEQIDLPEGEFDAVLCWNVLEHLPSLRPALANMAQALRPGGALILGLPDRSSLKGVITRLTPHAFHVWVYRHLLGSPNAGTPGFGPYRTYVVRDLSPRRLTALAATLQLELVYQDSHGRIPPLPRALRGAWRAVGAFGRLATLGRWDPLTSDLILVFRKATTHPPR